jgi:hypothetical protein
MNRPLYKIAYEIRCDWFNLSPHAKPYLDAMSTLDDIADNYYADSGESVVAYFLANAAGWKGATARAIKTELKQMLKGCK